MIIIPFPFFLTKENSRLINRAVAHFKILFLQDCLRAIYKKFIEKDAEVLEKIIATLLATEVGGTANIFLSFENHIITSFSLIFNPPNNRVFDFLVGNEGNDL